MSTTRFVILLHLQQAGDHWDLMLEHQGNLLTWRLPVGGMPGSGETLPVSRLPDHRLLYLDYEGAIRGDRGEVARVDGGQVLIEEFDGDRCIFELRGLHFQGAYRLDRVGESGPEWRLSAWTAG